MTSPAAENPGKNSAQPAAGSASELSAEARQRILKRSLPAPAAELPYRHGLTRRSLGELGRTHFIGIGGAGMSGVAKVLAARGIPVSGSDAADSAGLRQLSESGIRTFVGHDAAHLGDAQTVVISSAIRPQNPELAAALKLGIPVIHRSMALAAAAEGAQTVAVAGTHGKTTTTSMVTVMLKEAGQDPSFVVGGAVTGLGTNAHHGTTDQFVLEADESDSSYVNYAPRVAIVTNLEADHLDFYGTPEAVTASFDAFVSLLPAGAALVACADDPGSAALAQRHRAEAESGRLSSVQTYGYSPEADLRVISTEPFQQGTRSLIEFSLDGELNQQELILAVPGQHNVLNACAAFASGMQLGLDPLACAQALAAFRGASRRFEFKGEEAGVRVYDDYAHHPTEVQAAVAGAAAVTPNGQVRVVFQPHLYTRTEAFASEFAQALSAAGQALVLPVFRAREDHRDDVSAATITEADGADPAVLSAVQSPQEAVRILAAHAQPGDLIMTIGAGDVTELGPQIVAALADRARANA